MTLRTRIFDLLPNTVSLETLHRGLLRCHSRRAHKDSLHILRTQFVRLSASLVKLQEWQIPSETQRQNRMKKFELTDLVLYIREINEYFEIATRTSKDLLHHQCQELTEKRYFFQQYGATCHIAEAAINSLYENFLVIQNPR